MEKLSQFFNMHELELLKSILIGMELALEKNPDVTLAEYHRFLSTRLILIQSGAFRDELKNNKL